MLPMEPVRLQLGVLLAADPTTLAPVALANKVALVVNNFTSGENLVPGDLTLGSTNGLGPIDCAVGAQEIAIDAVSGDQQVTLIPGAAPGFRWVTSGGFAGPITIYGYALLDNAGATLLGVQKLATPITVQAAGFSIDLDPITFTFVTQPVS